MKDIDKKLEEALERELDFKLPEDFADKVLIRLEQSGSQSDEQMVWWITGLSIFLIGAAIGILAYFGTLQVFQSLAPYGLWIAIGLLFIGFIQILDQKLVKDKLKLS